MESQIKKLAIFASGNGTNAENIIRYFSNKPNIQIGLIVCNKPEAGVISIAQKHALPVLLIHKERFFYRDGYSQELKEAGIDLIILAGFLWKIPSLLINRFQNRIINIHPALLPKFGGKGMYGHFVHEAVIAQKAKETGITIHLVDEIYDNGRIIFQKSIPVAENETSYSIANKIHELEYRFYPEVIETYLKDLI